MVTTVRTWLYRVATSRCLNALRSSARRSRTRSPASTREAISLAFITALQLLPPRQRAVLILRGILGFHAGEVSQLLESTEESATSALERARGPTATPVPALSGAGTATAARFRQ
ncbi:MAG TPA: hypothetical protein DHU96_08665 [Actinobacteria bacterium]|nr:hypothetical protein [Actinomycetota bacterium]